MLFRSHRNQEVRELVPGDYPGTLVTDRGPSYEADELAGVDQQKCLSHLMGNVKEVVATKSGRARAFGEGVLNTLKQANQLWRDHRASQVGEEAFRQQGQEIEDQLTHQLRHRQLTDPDNAIPPQPGYRAHQQSSGTGTPASGDRP